MYAVIETGGKQYRVEVGTELEVELLDAEPGSNITLDRVLLVADGDESAIGRPIVADAAVEAEVVRRDRGEKLISFKYRPKARTRVKKGHRQELTVLRITDVRLGSKSAAADKRKAERTRRPSASASRRPPPSRPPRTPPSPRSWPRRRPPRRRPRPRRRPTRSRRRSRREGRRRRPTAEGRAGQGRRRRPRAPRPRAARPTPSRRAKPKAKPRHEEGRVDPMAHKKAGSSSKNGRDSVGQRLGVKVGDGQLVPAGSIIVRQRGMTFLAGTGTGPRPGLHRVRDDDRQGPVRARDEEQEADPRSRPSRPRSPHAHRSQAAPREGCSADPAAAEA